MLKLGLTAAERVAYDAARVGPHQVRTLAQIWSLDHVVLRDVSEMFRSGQANDDMTATVQTSATVELFDPLFRSGLDDTADLGAALPPKYMIHVTRGIFVPALDRWVDEPQFTGPIIRPTRNDDFLALECQSKEYLSLNKVWTPYVIKKGTNKVTAIRKILRDCSGEKFFNLKPTTAKLAQDISIGRDKSPWEVCQSIARGLGYVLFYDARGVCTARPTATSPAWEFRVGNGGSISTYPQRGYMEDGMINAIRFVGGVPDGLKSPVTATAVASPPHPYAPQNLRRGDPAVPRYVWKEVRSDSVTSRKVAKARANKALTSSLLDSVSLSFDAIPIGLESGDVYRVRTDSSVIDVRYRTASRPFGLGIASYGAIKRVSKTRRFLKAA